MKKLSVFGVFLVLGSTLVFTSCDRSPLDPNREITVQVKSTGPPANPATSISRDSNVVIQVSSPSPCPETTFYSVLPKAYLPEPRLGRNQDHVEVVVMGNLLSLRSWWQETFLPISKKYRGRVSFRFVNRRPDIYIPNLNQAFNDLARAGEAAGMRNRFWEYAAIITEKTDFPSPANLIVWAKEAGLNPRVFEARMNLPIVSQEVASDLAFSKAISSKSCCFGNLCYATISSSSFFIGTRRKGYDRLLEDPDFEKLSAMIDSLLALTP